MSTPVLDPASHIPVAPSTRMFTQDQLDIAVTEARRHEKDKLYSDMERSRKVIEELTTKLTAAEGKLTEIEKKGQETSQQQQADEVKKLREDLEAANKAAAEMDKKWEKLLDDALTRQSAEHEKKLQDRFGADDLKAYRESLIAGAQGKVISELVTGTTKEEIKASFDAAVQRYADVAKKAEDDLREKYKGILPAPVTPPAPGTETVQTTPLSNWRNLTPAQRTEELKKLKQKAFEEAGLPMRAAG